MVAAMSYGVWCTTRDCPEVSIRAANMRAKIVRENGGANQASAQVCSDCCRGIAGSLRHNAPYCPLSESLAGVLRMVKFRGGSARRGY